LAEDAGAAWALASKHHLVIVLKVLDDFDFAFENDNEIVGLVAISEEDLAESHLTLDSIMVQHR
jgi:hypothetical protein